VVPALMFPMSTEVNFNAASAGDVRAIANKVIVAKTPTEMWRSEGMWWAIFGW
jgi:hypothetical protein